MKKTSALLLSLVCLAAHGRVDTRVHETQVRGLSSALDALSDEAVALTNQFVGGPAVNAYASNAVSTYVSGFLPGLVGTYTFPFTTNAPLTFSDDTALTFGSLSASNVVAYKAYVAGAASSDLIDSEYAFLRGVRALTNLVSSSVLASGSIDSSRVVAGTLTVPAVGVSTAAVGTITSASGTQGVVVAGTNSLSFTGDVFVVDPGSADSRTRRHVVVHDAASGGIWYDPAVAVVDESSVLVSRASPLGLAAFPQAGSTGYQGVAGRTGFSPVFGGGPVAMSALPSSTSFASTRQQPGPYRLLVDQLPAVDAYQTASIMLRANPLDPQPPIDIPSLPPPWKMPPLPPLLDAHEVRVYAYDGALGWPLFYGPFFSWLVPEGETGAFVCPLDVAALAAGGMTLKFDVTTRPTNVTARVVVTNALLFVSGIEESFDVDVVVHPPPTVIVSTFAPVDDDAPPPPPSSGTVPDLHEYMFYHPATNMWTDCTTSEHSYWPGAPASYDDMDALGAAIEWANGKNETASVSLPSPSGEPVLLFLTKDAAYYGPHDRLLSMDAPDNRRVTGYWTRELFIQGPDGAVRVHQEFKTRATYGASWDWYGMMLPWLRRDESGAGSLLSWETRTKRMYDITGLHASLVPWGSTNLPPFTASARTPLTVENSFGTFYESGDALYGLDNFGSTYRSAFNPHAMGDEPLIMYDRVDFGTSVYDPGVPEYLARQFVYEEVGGGARVHRELDLIDTHGSSFRLYRDRLRLYAQRVGEPYLQFLRYYDGSDAVVLDTSNTNHLFVVDGRGSPGETGFGDPGTAVLMTSNQADAVDHVVMSRDPATGRVQYRVYRRKRYPQ